MILESYDRNFISKNVFFFHECIIKCTNIDFSMTYIEVSILIILLSINSSLFGSAVIFINLAREQNMTEGSY